MPRKFNQVLAAIVPQLKDEPQRLDECIHPLKYQKSNIIYNHVHYNIKISSQIKPEHLKSSSKEVRKILLGMKIFIINKKVKNVNSSNFTSNVWLAFSILSQKIWMSLVIHREYISICINCRSDKKINNNY